MPLAYDAFFWGGGQARSDGLCSYCADPQRHKDQVASLEGRPWMLGMLLRIHRLGRGFARGLSWALSRVAALGSENLARLARRGAEMLRLSDRERRQIELAYAAKLSQ